MGWEKKYQDQSSIKTTEDTAWCTTFKIGVANEEIRTTLLEHVTLELQDIAHSPRIQSWCSASETSEERATFIHLQ